jgi:phenylacetate-CoA ligase
VFVNRFKASLIIQGYPLRKALSHYEELKREYSRDPIAYAEKWKWAITQFHLDNNPFYQAKTAGTIKTWQDLPVLTKSDFQLPLHDMITPGWKNSYYKGKTSGSSGKPLFFVKDKYCHAVTWANILDLYSRHGIDYGRSLQARFYAMPLEAWSKSLEKLKDYLSSRIRFVIHDMSDQRIEEFLTTFRKKSFKYIYGYTNSLVLLARYLKRENIVLSSVCPSLAICIVTSEVCAHEDKKLLESSFGVPVINEYGSSEVSIIAFGDQEHNWRICGELLYVEVLDDDNRPLPSGEVGKIVVTSFFNKAMPFIRYEVGDRGAIVNEEKNGPVLRQLYGRLNDTLRLPSGKVIPGFTFYYVTKAMMDRVPGLREYNIRQTAVDTLEFDLVIDSVMDARTEEEIRRLALKYLEPGMKMHFRKVEKIIRTPSGKMKHFQALQD